MNESHITLQGWLGGDVRLHRAGETPVAQFRLACTPRRFSRKNDAWSDGETQWYTVRAWRGLGEHCDQSLHRGDPVVVHGRLEVHRWVNASGTEVTDLEVDATFVGHDLNRGVSTFTRTARATAEQAPVEPAPVESAPVESVPESVPA